MIYKCIYNSDSHNRLTLNRNYKVLDINTDEGVTIITIEDNLGDIVCYYTKDTNDKIWFIKI